MRRIFYSLLASVLFTITAFANCYIVGQVTPTSCGQSNNGAIDITVTGGTPPYVYLWSNGATTQDISGLTAGSYTVTVTDAKNYQTQATFIVGTSKGLDIKVLEVNKVTCAGACNGSVKYKIVGGTPPYMYIINYNNSIDTIYCSSNQVYKTGLCAGTYKGKLIDALGCTYMNTLVITEANPLVVTGNITHDNCNASAGAIDVSVSGGTAPYTYVWSNGATTQDIKNLAAGIYRLIVTDANGCTDEKRFVLCNFGNVRLKIRSFKGVSCNGACDASISYEILGGVAPYTYVVKNGKQTDTIISNNDNVNRNNLCAGTYHVSLTDANNCQYDTLFVITEPDKITVTSEIISADCGKSDGSIDITVSGGIVPYTYKWSNGSKEEDLTSVPSGEYTVIITDAKGCIYTETYIIKDKNVLRLEVSNIQGPNCSGDCNGQADYKVINGDPRFIYYLTFNGETDTLSSSKLYGTKRKLCAGEYNIVLTDSKGCSYDTTVLITEPDKITVTSEIISADCDQANASIKLTVVGGTKPYSYLWSNGATTKNISGLSSGEYTVVVTDANGCKVEKSFEIQLVNSFTIKVDTIVGTSCYGTCDGAASVTVTGGTPPYHYTWANGSSTSNINGLCGGLYGLVVEDANGCQKTKVITIPTPGPIKITGNPTHVSCPGDSNGIASVLVAGGTQPYTYLWSNGDTTDSITNLSVGIYHVKITDANGCMATGTVNIYDITTICDVDSGYTTFIMDDFSTNTGFWTFDEGWSIGAGCTPNTCSGVPNAFYDFNNHTTSYSRSMTGKEVNGCGYDSIFIDYCYRIDVSPFNNPIQQLLLEVTTDGGATWNIVKVQSSNVPNRDVIVNRASISSAAGNDFQIRFRATGPGGNFRLGGWGVDDIHLYGYSKGSKSVDPLALSYNVENINCDSSTLGSIDITVSGGVKPYNFIWSNGSKAEDIENLTAGVYSIIVADGNGCTIEASFTISQISSFVLNTTVTNITCNGDDSGAIMLEVIGGQAPYTFTWSNGDNSQNLENISAGVYEVVVVDANGCMDSIMDTILENDPISIVPEVGNVTCNGENDGYINLLVEGGIAPYNLLWNTGDTTPKIDSLTAGIYEVEITDSAGCKSSFAITVKEASTLTAEISSPEYSNGANVSAYGAEDGKIILEVNGGTPPYSYEWSTEDTTMNLYNLPAGEYSVVITDANGCKITKTITLREPAIIEMPNAFSPNNDGSNDNYVIRGIEFYPNNNFQVFNRWGEQVYQKDNYANDWFGKNRDGKDLPDGTYFGILTVYSENVQYTDRQGRGGIEVKTKDNKILIETYIDLRRK